MRSRLLLLCLTVLLPALAAAQLQETTVADTAYVKMHIAKRDTAYTLINTITEGRWIVYFDSLKQKKALVCNYISGKGAGTHTDTLWDRPGNIRATRTLSAQGDTLFENEYYRNGALRRERLSIWRKYTGSWDLQKDNSYFGNGQPTGTAVNYKDSGIQHLSEYYETGEKWRDYNWQNGIFVGSYKEFYENDQPKVSGQYVTKVSPEQKAALKEEGIKTGKWKYYDAFGRLVREELYENGALVKTTMIRQ